MQKSDTRILERATKQHGVVSRAQLLALGLTGTQVDCRIRNGLLRPLHRGVFQVGPVVTEFGPAMAACLACGRTAAVSHVTAGVLTHILKERPEAPIDVTVVGTTRVHVGLRVHRVSDLPAREVQRHRGIRITSPMRTLLDLAAVLSVRELERVVAESIALGLIRERSLLRFVDEHAGARGARALRGVLAGSLARLRSEAEGEFRDLMAAAGLPEPEANRHVLSYEVDFVWRRQRLIVEVDGARFHMPRAAFEQDRRRDAELTAAGWRVIRVTWNQITRESHMVVARVAQALGVASPT
jgi:very-short-patch-repair endonuclease